MITCLLLRRFGKSVLTALSLTNSQKHLRNMSHIVHISRFSSPALCYRIPYLVGCAISEVLSQILSECVLEAVISKGSI